ncbi:diaminopimelate epimerase [Acidipropionibacterium acidipropionici]|jgi:diaminopimelate epimerase|nr:diaminopimelate epimerase [Acidipropionibacterium acidipropionici]ALN16114.1 diaminopimelate epimerase [Acidipropionibacterium acidipropionici]APZ08137.1 diaminopimelate epimerase [Acidipropionibacterium acidipropionici]MDN6556786.1 diaminopimelate epimerase [Acidipropionibacterium acidipropionici]QCV95149.1 diaminopimelate epimerase [Acidipropionibacterium acidipropionici]
MRTTQFSKGQGTGNDFVILRDRSGMLNLTDDQVRWLCDRRFGVGGDGLLRATRAGLIPEWEGDPDLWFMDYRNADASIAEMCGNGLRVFARFLVDEGLLSRHDAVIATRAGLKHVIVHGNGTVDADIGPARTGGDAVEIRLGERSWSATPVDVGNPHAVVRVDSEEELAGLDLTVAPVWDPPESFPNGVNVEFVALTGPDRIRMRVHERGVGETLSCGTGTVAAAAAMSRPTGHEGAWTVDVPGGTLVVTPGEEDSRLTGPAVIQARGEVFIPEL